MLISGFFLALQEEMEKNRKVSTGMYHFFAGNAILIWQWNLISNLGSIFVAKKIKKEYIFERQIFFPDG